MLKVDQATVEALLSGVGGLIRQFNALALSSGFVRGIGEHWQAGCVQSCVWSTIVQEPVL